MAPDKLGGLFTYMKNSNDLLNLAAVTARYRAHNDRLERSLKTKSPAVERLAAQIVAYEHYNEVRNSSRPPRAH